MKLQLQWHPLNLVKESREVSSTSFLSLGFFKRFICLFGEADFYKENEREKNLPFADLFPR